MATTSQILNRIETICGLAGCPLQAGVSGRVLALMLERGTLMAGSDRVDLAALWQAVDAVDKADRARYVRERTSEPPAQMFSVDLRQHGCTPEFIGAASLEEASLRVREWQDARGLGASDLDPGHGLVCQAGKVVARISYNGRIWPTTTAPAAPAEKGEV